MGFNIGKFVEIGLRIAPLVISAVDAVENLFDGKGQDKEEEALRLAGLSIRAIESIMDKDVLHDPSVQEAARNLIRAYVAFQNAIANKEK